MIFYYTHKPRSYPVVIREAFFQQQMGADIKTHTQTSCGESLDGRSPSNAFPQSSGNEVEAEAERLCQRVWRTTVEQGPLNRLNKVYMSSQKLKQQEQCPP